VFLHDFYFVARTITQGVFKTLVLCFVMSNFIAAVTAVGQVSHSENERLDYEIENVQTYESIESDQLDRAIKQNIDIIHISEIGLSDKMKTKIANGKTVNSDRVLNSCVRGTQRGVQYPHRQYAHNNYQRPAYQPSCITIVKDDDSFHVIETSEREETQEENVDYNSVFFILHIIIGFASLSKLSRIE